MNENTLVATSPGATSGNRTRQKIRAGPAPSIAAASSISLGTAATKLRSIQMEIGTLAAVHLLRLAARPGRGGMRIALIDRLGRHGLGQAYSTTHPAHLLNSPADKMSAVAGDPGHLLRWAQADGADRAAPDGFLPRPAYGRYLCDTLAEAQRAAQPSATVRHITS